MSDEPTGGAVAPLSVETDLTVRVDGAELNLSSTGERLLVDVASLADAVRVLRARPPGGEARLDAVLTATDLTVEVRVRDRIVAVVGADASPGALSRRLDLDPVEVRADGALGAVGAELAAVDAAFPGGG